jgi:hypothetical protein
MSRPLFCQLYANGLQLLHVAPPICAELLLCSLQPSTLAPELLGLTLVFVS